MNWRRSSTPPSTSIPALAFATEVSKFVAQGACRNYRNARSRWLNKKLKARRPIFHKKTRTGTGSFLAASGVKLIQYDGHRRIRLPYLGSVRMTRSLPDGGSYEVTIRKRNGRWYANIAYWKPPIAPPQRETQSVGGVDVGITPLAVDSDDVHYQNPKALDSALRKLRRWQRAKERRTLGSRGWWEAQRRLDAVQRRVTGLRNNAHHQVSRELVPEVPRSRYRDVERRRHDESRPAIQGIGRRRYVEPAPPDPLQGPVVRHPHR